MKKAGKLLPFLLVLTIVFSLSVTALAAETYTITINGSGSTDKHIYEAYQIFKGDLHLSETNTEGETTLQNKVLSNIVWGSGVSSDASGFAEAFKDAATEAKDLVTSEQAQAFAKKIAPYLSETHADASSKNGAGNYEISGLEPGYYLVKDKTTGDPLAGADDFYTAYMLKVVADVTATPKGDKPTLSKAVRDEMNGNWDTDKAGYQIGETVDFQLTVSVPNINFGYSDYTYTITDTMSSGLTSKVTGKNDVTIKVNDVTELGKDYYDVTVDEGNPNLFYIAIYLKKAMDEGFVVAGNKLHVYYSAELNEKAEYYGHDPEDVSSNTASLTYPNDPNSNSTGKTPDAVVKVWTFPTTITKVDGKEMDGESPKKLTGAKFVLSTNGSLTLANLELDKNFKPTKTDELIAFYTGDGAIAPYEVASPERIKANKDITYVIEAGSATMAGLGEKAYYLYEIKAPDGYNLLTEPTKFTIHLPQGDIMQPVNAPYLTLGDSADPQPRALTIANTAGATLPETGGIGSTLFYVIGGLLVVGAGVLLVTKKRMGKADN